MKSRINPNAVTVTSPEGSGENRVIVTTNLTDFRRELNSISEEMRTKIVRAANATAGRIFKDAIFRYAPWDTGTLKAAIFYRRLNRDSNALVQRAEVGIRHLKGRRERVADGVVKITTWKGNTARFGGKNAGKFSGKFLDAYYARWVEEGHILRGLNFGEKLKGGNAFKALTRKRIRAAGGRTIGPQWFVRNSARAAQPGALEAFYKVVDNRLKKVWENPNGSR